MRVRVLFAFLLACCSLLSVTFGAIPLELSLKPPEPISIRFDTDWCELSSSTSGLDAQMQVLAEPIQVPEGKVAYVQAVYGIRYRAIAENLSPEVSSGCTFVSTFDFSLGMQIGTTLCGTSFAGTDLVPFEPPDTLFPLHDSSLDHQILLSMIEAPGAITGPFFDEVRLEGRFYGGLWFWDHEVVSQNSSHVYPNAQGHPVGWHCLQDHIGVRLRGIVRFVDAPH